MSDKISFEAGENIIWKFSFFVSCLLLYSRPITWLDPTSTKLPFQKREQWKYKSVWNRWQTKLKIAGKYGNF